MENKIEIGTSGLVCDNKECDWMDKSIPFEVWHEWINRPCPKCGANLLTLEDYNTAVTVFETMKFIGSLSEDELKNLAKNVKPNPEVEEKFKDINPGEKCLLTVHTHKGIDFDVKPLNSDNDL